MSARSSQETWNGRLELVGKAVGIVIVLAGTGAYLITRHAETIVFSTGVLFFLGGAGAGLSERLRRPPDRPSKE
jgi:hypothetical protein